LIQSWKVLRGIRPDLAIDIQGLIQSALVGRASRPSQFWGWEASAAREPLASRFYTHRVHSEAVHVIDRNLDLIRQAGATSLTRDVYIPSGRREGSLPASPFVLVHPFAGWASKQWPLENYGRLASALASFDVALVANVPPQRARELTGIPNLHVHSSSLEGLIGATRDAVAVVGLDSGPMHLADALGKPGVALFGPTDPTRNGPYGGTIRVLRAGGALTTYKRNAAPDLSMTTITVHDVLEALLPQLQHSEPRV
jgi:heptosyltransferase-1